MKVQAYVLFRMYPNKIKEVIQHVQQMKGVLQAHAVTGPFDGIAYVEAGDIKELGRLILSEIQNLDGVRDTTTCLVVDIE
ncbi:MAG: Lrp/AsnC family transcriptional regulator [Calditrichaeota bacterium]|nr:Lrp/AsnC family transcriptional regulator [Calditrichota bacterium]